MKSNAWNGFRGIALPVEKAGFMTTAIKIVFCCFVFSMMISSVHGQNGPRISALFPAGAQAGQTVEVAVRGGNLTGASSAMINGAPGVTAELLPSGLKVDEKAKPAFEKACASCHELRSPANRTLTPEQWAATVDRMITARNAQINKTDRDAIVGYLQGAARAGQVIARVTVSKDAIPGVREVRVVTDKGVSSAFSFEVGALPETLATIPNTTLQSPQAVATPVVINGVMTNSGQRDWFGFAAKKGERLVFNLKGYRLNESAQYFFNPVLYLYDASGKELIKNLGRFGLDPLIDWTAPTDGNYVILVRDMLWKGSPASVYRLSIASQPYDAILTPSGPAKPGTDVATRVAATMPTTSGSASAPTGGTASGFPVNFKVRVPEGADGVTMVSTPIGDAPLLVRDLPDGGEPQGARVPAVSLPAVFHGTLRAKGQSDIFHVRSNRPGTGLEFYSRRLGSPLRVRVIIRDAKTGNEIHRRDADEVNDLRFDGAFPSPGAYLVEVSDVNGDSGSSFAYSWEALDGAPDFIMTATPDVTNLQPGSSMPILIRAVRRDNLKSAIQVRLSDLPPGVTATEGVLPPDDDKVTLVVTAAANAAPASRTTSIVGIVNGNNGAAARRARVLEDFRYNGQPRFFPRNAAVISVTKTPTPFALRWKAGSEKAVFVPNKDKVPTATVTLEIVRQNGYQGDAYIYFPTLPPGIYAESGLYLPKDKNEGSIILHANGDARYLDPKQPRPFPNLPPISTVAIANVGGDPTIAISTSPLILSVP